MLRIFRAEALQQKVFDEWQALPPADVESQVAAIIAGVRDRGDAALVDFTHRFDGAALSAAGLRVSGDEIQGAYDEVDPEFLVSLRAAAERITAFHRRQLKESWFAAEDDGSFYGQLVRPLERVGIYVPGGTASYPSSVLMNAIPARVAGVKRVVMVTPPRADGTVSPPTLVAAAESGIDEVYRVGGAQAIAALAYGTGSIPRVDKITGPGNIYVTAAKRLVYGQVDIDMLAGPSEVLVVADRSARADWVAADLIAQAEHDFLARAILVTPEEHLAQEVNRELAKQLGDLPRREIASRALREKGLTVVVKDLAEAMEIANGIAPEHLELAVADPWAILPLVKSAGAVFLGHHTPEALGDYYAGPNHVLPTGGSARFFSGLGVDTFLRRTNLLASSARGVVSGSGAVAVLARAEGLEGHARAVEKRVGKDKGGE